mmetsp:Transcript_24687/g.71197  ORF Transcript_24687/g.71197 Transcript_24687/m.71197 type:complete len:206 (+) Transcript_24687:628-1245(+)
MGWRTTEPAPTLAPSPIEMFPSTDVPAPMSTSLPTLGWRSLPLLLPVPPKVTPCRREQPSPTTAVSPMTMPVAWSNMMALPMVAAGWMSTPNAADAWLCSQKETKRDISPGTPVALPHRRRAARCKTSAANPLKNSNGSSMVRQAGSRSTQASTSSRTASAMVQPSTRSSLSSASLMMSLTASGQISGEVPHRLPRRWDIAAATA